MNDEVGFCCGFCMIINQIVVLMFMYCKDFCNFANH